MTEIYTYRCDICGKTFDDEYECREHEMKHKAAKLKDAVVMMDPLNKILPLDDIHTAIERTFAIYVGCKEAADILWELFEDEGYNPPIRDIVTPVLYPAFFIYNKEDCRWLYLNDLEEEYNRLLALKITAENALLH